MRDMNISEFRQLEVVNLYDGRILGNISDFLINIQEGKIEGIIILEKKTIFNSKDEYIIPWSEIKKIGEEVILVAHDRKIQVGEHS